MKLATRNHFFKEIIKILNRCEVIFVPGKGEIFGSTFVEEDAIYLHNCTELNSETVLVHECLHQYFGELFTNEEQIIENLERELMRDFNDTQHEAIRLYIPKRR